MKHLPESNDENRSCGLSDTAYEYLINMIDCGMEDNEIAFQLGINEGFVQKAKRETIID